MDDSATLKDVCTRLFGTPIYEKEYEDRTSGQYFKVIDTDSDEIYFVVFNNTNSSRNTRLVQPFPVAYADYQNETNVNKHIGVYFKNVESSDKTNYAKFFYRCFLTFGVELINQEVLGLSDITPFINYEDLKIARQQNREANTGNESSFFMNDDTQITFYGKNDGVNSKESFILAMAVSKIAKMPVIYYPIKSDVGERYKEIMVNSGITIETTLEILPGGSIKPATTRETSRNTAIFHYNLRDKFGDKKCYLCSCDLEHLVIGAHIERITDIDHNASYTPTQKSERATDGNNGFWLCANHDKMFEYGIIYFDQYTMRLGSSVSEVTQRDFIKKSIFGVRKTYSDDIEDTVFEIKTEHRNEKMLDYINKHAARHGLTI